MKRKFCLWMMVAAGVSVIAATGDASLSNSQYLKIVKPEIKRNQVFSFETFQADLIWGVLYLTPEVREAVWNRESWITEKSAEIHSVIIPASQVRGTQFVLGMYAPKGSETFDLTPETFWALKLDQDGNEYTPITIEPLPNSPLVKRLIPFTHHWAKLYVVTFAGDFQKPFTLRMVGAIAKGVIVIK